jgi:hypothetical protein
MNYELVSIKIIYGQVGFALTVNIICSPQFVPSLIPDIAVKSSTRLSDDEEEQNDPAPGIFQLLFIPDVFMAMLSLFVYCMAFTFYEPALATHLSTVPSRSRDFQNIDDNLNVKN